jgi:preprotein translocase subunit SecD
MVEPALYCPRCGTRRLPDARYCGGCGMDLDTVASGPPRAAAQVADPAVSVPLLAPEPGPAGQRPRSARWRVPVGLAAVLLAGLAISGAILVGGGALSSDGPSEAQRARAARAGQSPAVEVEFQVMPIEGRAPEAADILTVRDIIDRRASAMSIGHPEVETRGTDRVIVRLPGRQDTSAIRGVLGSTGRFDLVSVPVTESPPVIGDLVDLQRSLFSGDQIREIVVDEAAEGTAGVRLTLRLKEPGREVLGAWTASHVGSRLVLAFEGLVLAQVRIESEITGDLSIPTDMPRAVADDFIVIARFGSLPFPVRELPSVEIPGVSQ